MVKKNLYKKELDGLRGIAVLAVIFNHFNNNFLPSGYLGVDIFFVISGYVITMSLINKRHYKLLPFFTDFISRRIKRLLPILLIFVSTTALMVMILNPTPGYFLWSGIYSLIGISNIEFWKNTVDYFAPSTLLNPFTHTWSLSVEAQFYVVFPFLIYFGGYQKLALNKKNILITLLFITIFSFTIYFNLYNSNKSAAYFLMPSRAWELTTGSIIFFTQEKISNFFRKSIIKVSNLIPILIIGIFLLPNNFPVIATFLIVTLTAILIATINTQDFIYKILTSKDLRYVGIISYSLYLWHWGILALSRQSIGIYWWTIPFQILLILLLSHLSYKYIERPFIEKSWPINKIIFSGLISITLIVSFIVFLGSNRKFIYAGKFPFESFKSIGRLNNFQTGDNLNNFKRNIDGNAIYIFGDSHAYNLFPSLKNISKKYNFNKIFYLNHQQEKWDFDELNQKVTGKDILIYSGRAYWEIEKIVKSNIEDLIGLAKIKNTKLILVDDLVPFGENYNIDFFKDFTFFRNGPSISRTKAEKRRSKYTNLLKSYVDNKTIFYIDPLPKVCDAVSCKAVIEGKLIYADGSPHFNKEGSLILNNLWLEKLPEILF